MKYSMKGTLLAAVGAVALLAGTAASNAATATFGTYTFAYSNGGLTAPFGSVTVTGTLGGTATVTENVAPNFLLNTGAGQPLAFNLNQVVGQPTATIIPASVNAPFSIGGSDMASPFGTFNNTIQGACGSGASSGGCGSTLTFMIANFQGFVSNAYNTGSSIVAIFFASDIIDNSLPTTGGTGNVGAGDPSSVPLPAAAPLFAAGLGLMGWLSTRRRRRETAIQA